jgi:predicted metal-dependent hydrolase
MNNLIQESFQRLFPEKEFKYQSYLEYNRRLSNFNANIKYDYRKISVHLNLQWKDIDDEIKIGLIQSLLLKVFKRKRKNTQNIELYNNFIKNIPILTEKTKSDPILEASFERVNQNFFFSQIEQPNLTWGTDSKRKLASYNYHDDTVTVSTIFKEVNKNILDYLMYHELLHKHHQFKHKNGRSFFHTKSFKDDENLYPNKNDVENEISQIIKNSKINSQNNSKNNRKPQKRSIWNFLN